MPDTSSPHILDALKLVIGGAIGLVVFIFTRSLGRVDALEKRMDTLVTKREVQERCESLANLIKESQRADKAEIRSILQKEIQAVLAPHLTKKHFGSLKHGFVGEIEDDE